MDRKVWAAGVAGGAAVAGQAALVREFLTLFSGLELAAGLLLVAWLAWAGLGSLVAARLARDGRGLGPALALAGAGLPLAVLLARAARPLLGIVPGGFPDLGQLALLAAALPALPGPALGFVFAAAWAGAVRPLAVYLAEAAGAALAGLAFTFLLLPCLGLLGAALAAGTLAAACGLALAQGRAARLATGLALALLLGGLAGLPALERISAAWRFGPGVAAIEDTPYQTLAVTCQAGQYTLFADGGWRLSAPDPESAQWAAHPALLAHLAPRRVLLLGGDPCGLAAEALRHASVRAVDVVDADPAAPLLLQRTLPPGLCAAAADARVRIHARDAAIFVRRVREPYDVALMGLGEPVGLGLARFYSLEFFTSLRAALGPDGVLAFALPGSPDALGPAQARALAGVRATLAAAFPEVLVLPGASVRFLAGVRPGLLPFGPDLLLRRLAERGLDLAYLRPDSLEDAFNPWRRATLDAALDAAWGAAGPGDVNRDLAPTACLDALRAWLRQLAPGLPLPAAPARAGAGFWAALAIASAGLGLWLSRGGIGRAAAGCVALAGGAGMALSLALLLGIQVLAGTLASRLALLAAGYMAGLALGAAWVQAAGWAGRPALARLAAVLAGTCLALAATGPLLGVLAAQREVLAGLGLDAAFAGLALGCGLLGGLHFGLASRVLGADAWPGTGLGGRLYALDLAGAALFLLPATLAGFPLLGFSGTLLAAALPCLAGLGALLVAFRRNGKNS